jgi:hypothetical protein
MKWPATFRFAARFSERHSATVGARSLDILHVAAAKAYALGASRQAGVRRYVTNSAQQRVWVAPGEALTNVAQIIRICG